MRRLIAAVLVAGVAAGIAVAAPRSTLQSSAGRSSAGASSAGGAGDPPLPTVDQNILTPPLWHAAGYQWADRWSYNTEDVTLAPWGSNLTDHVIPLVYPSGLRDTADCSDVQVWQYLGVTSTEYSFEAEGDCRNGPAVLWVEVPTVVDDTDILGVWVYYGHNLNLEPSHQDVAGTWSNSYALVWHLSTLSDSTGTANDLTENTSSGSLSPVQGVTPLGLGYDYNGAARGHESTGNGVGFWPQGQDLTLTAVFKADTIQTQNIAGMTGISNQFRFNLQTLGVNAQYRGIVNTTPTGSAFAVSAGLQFSAGEWTHVAETFDQSDVRVYGAAGTQIATLARAEPVVATNASGKFDIGTQGASPSAAITVSEVRVASVARTPEWVEFEAQGLNGNVQLKRVTVPERMHAHVVAWSDSWGNAWKSEFCGYDFPAPSTCQSFGIAGYRTRGLIYGTSGGASNFPHLLDHPVQTARPNGELESNYPSPYIPPNTTHLVLASGPNDAANVWDQASCDADCSCTCTTAQMLAFHYTDPLEDAILTLRAKGIEPVLWKTSVLCGVGDPTCAISGPVEAYAGKYDDMNGAIDSLAATYNVSVVDAYSHSLDIYDRGLWTTYYTDHAHPIGLIQDEGMRYFGQLVAQAVAETAPAEKWYQGIPRAGLRFWVEMDIGERTAGDWLAAPRTLASRWFSSAGWNHYLVGFGAIQSIQDGLPSGRSYAHAVDSTGRAALTGTDPDYTTGILPLGSTDRTLAWVFRTTDTTTFDRGFVYGNTTDTQNVVLGTRNGNCAFATGTASTRRFESSVDCSDGAWHMLMWVLHDATEWELYDNGVLIGDSVTNGSILAPATAEGVSGGIGAATVPALNSHMQADQFGAYVWDHALSDAERAQWLTYVETETGL